MKKIAGLILGLVCTLLLGVTAAAGSCDIYYGSNENAQSYYNYATTVKSYLHVCSDGRLMRVQYLVSENKLLAEYYDSSYNLLSSKTVIPEFSVFGGWYPADDYYYVLTGQSNPSESSSVTCFAVTKYDKNWNRIATAELRDCNTTIPFDAGSARFCHTGKYLLIRTSHEMYKSEKDGRNHQANVTIQLDMSTMRITDSFTRVASTNYGYVSHSFNQFIKVDSDRIVALDHGDAYPRSIVLTKYQSAVSSGKFTPAYNKPCNTVDMLTISGTVGANYTGCSVGGFEITSSGYLAAISSIKQGSGSDIRNIYLSYCDKNSSSPELKQITYYTSQSASTPHLVKINDGRFIVLWYYDGRVHYCEADAKGNIIGGIMSLEGALSDCHPVVYSGRLVWYVWDNSEVTFFSISLSDFSSVSSNTYVFGHSYAPVSVNGTTVNLRCSKCAGVSSGKVPSSFVLWWEDSSLSGGGYTYYSSEIASSYHPDDTVGLMVKYTPADLNDYEVISSDESVAKIVSDDDEYSVRAVGEGTAKITVRSKYSHDIKKTYTFNVSHRWIVKENTEATCEVSGRKIKSCSVCSESTVETVPAKGHKMSSYKVTKEATCKAAGKKTSTCSVCGHTDSAEIPKKEHDSKVTVKGTDATCTKQGKTEGKKCSFCGTVTVAQETIPALGHDLGEYKITKKPTCTAKGEETAKCTRCSYTKTQDVERIPHTEVTVKATAPTCTKSGKTEGKKCSVCNKMTVEQETVEAPGHELGEYKITKKPTCTAKGEETAKCTRCSYTKTQDVERIPHTELTVKAVAPTCTKSGKTAGKKCSVCGKITVEQQTVEALGHELGEYKITKKPTCTAKGEETAKCTRCSYIKTQDVERISHTEVTVKATAPTCTKSGKTEGKKCSICGKITVEQETVEALGHELGEYKITKKPTCTAKGEETAKCTRCSYTKSRDAERLPHTEVNVKAVAPTCTKSGKTEGKKCSVCNKITVEQETVEALGHELGEYKITKEPTCTAKGEKEAKCIRCSYTKTADISKAAHEEVTVEAVAPTCTKSGKTEGKKCSVCNKITVVQETVKALGHNKKITVLATATTQANGSISSVCERCGEDFGQQRVYRINSISLSSTKCTYSGKTKTPSVRVVDYNKDTLIKDEDYTVTYSEGRKDIGEYSVEVNFIGKYSGSEMLSFSILPGKTSEITATQSTSVVKLKWSEVKGANGYRIYRYDSKTAGYEQIASVKNTTEYRVTKLKAGTSYKFAVQAYYKDGNGKVYFSDSKKAIATATDPVVPTVSLKLSGKTAVLSWDKCTGADGYQVYYSTSKGGEYKKLKSTSALSLKKSGLKSGNKYYFKVRAYKKTSSGTVFGGFSKVKSVKIK